MSVSLEHGDGIGIAADRDHIWVPISVDVADRERRRVIAQGKVPRRSERAIAVPCVQQDRRAVATGHGDVQPAVPVEIGNNRDADDVARRDVLRGLERAVASPPQDRQRSAVALRDVSAHDVGLAVAVEIPDRDSAGPRGHAIERGRAERPVPVPEQHRDLARKLGEVARIRHHQIETAVPIQVTQGIAPEELRDREIRFGPERAVAVPRPHADSVIGGYDQVQASVCVEIGGGEKTPAGRDRVPCTEAPVAVAEQQRIGAVVVGRDQVELPVAVEIPGDHAPANVIGGGAGRVILMRPERAVAVAEQHGDALRAVVGDGSVELPVAIQVREHQELRMGAGGVIGPGLKLPAAEPQENRDGVVVFVRAHEIRVAVAIEVGDGERAWKRSAVEGAERRGERDLARRRGGSRSRERRGQAGDGRAGSRDGQHESRDSLLAPKHEAPP